MVRLIMSDFIRYHDGEPPPACIFRDILNEHADMRRETSCIDLDEPSNHALRSKYPQDRIDELNRLFDALNVSAVEHLFIEKHYAEITAAYPLAKGSAVIGPYSYELTMGVMFVSTPFDLAMIKHILSYFAVIDFDKVNVSRFPS